MNKHRKYIKIEGVVQGVGFRPFVFRIALEHHLKGWVMNTDKGVFIEVEGPEKSMESFMEVLTAEAPPLSRIDKVMVEDLPWVGYEAFTIEKSGDGQEAMTLISPDVSVCKDCEREIKDRQNMRFAYPFTNCTNCGPRFSIIKKLPYDRGMTTMESFTMCPHCKEEYDNPLDRRFHAQPNACPQCGPRVWLADNSGNPLAVEHPIDETVRLLKAGKIIGLKGLGGFHLICDGKNEEAIGRLRQRKIRPWKPFALMMRDMATVKFYCHVNEVEEKILTGIQKPILLLDKKERNLPDDIAPQQKRYGVMLPYTPLHYLIFDEALDVLVMTSGNVNGLPLEHTNDGAVERLGSLVDYFLLHNRDIHIPVDDSVARVVLGKERLIRRARGYAPLPIKIEGLQETLACGSHLKNVFSISKKELVFLSQHIGDLENIETYGHFKACLEHFKRVYQIEPKLIAHDMHPGYLSSGFAEEETGIKVAVQHHHAHIVSCMVEHSLDKRVIGLAFDGTGYGPDGKIWGGEFLICDFHSFERVGHLNYVKMPGGDLAVKESGRMAVSHLYEIFHEALTIPPTMDMAEDKVMALIAMLKNGLNAPETSSMGRLFDAVAGLLGIRERVTYEGQGAIELEAAADGQDFGTYAYQIREHDGMAIVCTDRMFEEILKDISNNVDKGAISQRFHNTVSAFSIDMCERIRRSFGLREVVLSGGVFQNEILLKGVYQGLKDRGFDVYIHEKIPCNDGGIALGQMVIANQMTKRRMKELCV